MAKPVTPKTLQEAVRYYSDPDVCQQELASSRWPNGVTCPTCGRKDVAYLANQRRWQCRSKHAKRQFSAKVGTIFEDSPIGLDKWFVAMWLLSSAKNGISSYELHRAIGVTQKTAWFMLHRIRLAMQHEIGGGKLGGVGVDVEVDETFIGGKARNMHEGPRKRRMQRGGHYGKVAVQGLLERHNKEGHSIIKLEVVPNNRRRHVDRNVRKYVRWGSEVHTDELGSYNELGDDYMHNVINHAEKYVDGNVHTNGCENFWSLLKRSLKGTYVSVEPFHLFRYLDEQAFRFNTRKDVDGGRFADVLRAVVDRRVTYAQLIGNKESA